MQLLADENVHRRVVARLRGAGFDVEWIKETQPGEHDSDILSRPDIASVILITHDRDFGELLFRHGLPTPYAVLYVRLEHRLADETADRLIAQLEAGVAGGQLITITKSGARAKPFSAGETHG